jgi:hypothetical protein
MPETARLLDLARMRLRDGLLPSNTSTTALGGRSNGASCGLCGGRLEPGAAEIELVWDEGDVPRRTILHPACHGAWLTASRVSVVGEPS